MGRSELLFEIDHHLLAVLETNKDPEKPEGVNGPAMGKL